MKSLKQLLLFIFALSSLPLLYGQDAGPIMTHPLKIGEVVRLTSNSLNEDRDLNIYLPMDYHPDSSKKYPVIYLLDGSMHEDFLHIVGLTQFHSYSWIQHIPECIVVGISNVNRYRDFTFEPKNKEYLETDPRWGGSAAFLDFLEKEVQPFIEKAYPTSNEKIIIGQSLGGLLATEILLRRPEMFNHYYIISPSLWYDDMALLEEDLKENYRPSSVFVAVGKEGKIMVSGAKKLNKELTKAYGKEIVSFEYFPHHDHSDVLHQAINNGFEKNGKLIKK